MTKPIEYRKGDIVRLNYRYSFWESGQRKQFKEVHGIVQIMEEPKTIFGNDLVYAIQLPDLIWVPRSAILRRARADEVAEYHARLQSQSEKVQEPAIDSDTSSFTDTLKQLFQGIPNIPVEPLKPETGETKSTSIPSLIGEQLQATADKISGAGNILSALLGALVGEDDLNSDRQEATFSLSADACKELEDAVDRAAAIAEKHGVPFIVAATCAQEYIQTAAVWRLRNMMVTRNLCRSRWLKLHRAVGILLAGSDTE